MIGFEQENAQHPMLAMAFVSALGIIGKVSTEIIRMGYD